VIFQVSPLPQKAPQVHLQSDLLGSTIDDTKENNRLSYAKLETKANSIFLLKSI